MRITDWVGVKTLSLLALVFVMYTAQVMAKTASGTVITNQAEISWLDTADGIRKNAFSNVSTVVVGEQYSILLTSDNERYARSSQIVDLPHRLINTGNTPSTYVLRVGQGTNDSGNLIGVKLYSDVSGNGIVDAGEAQLPETTCDPLEEGVTCYLISEMDPGDVTEFVVSGATSLAAVGDHYDVGVRVYPEDYSEILASEQNTAAKGVPPSIEQISAKSLSQDWVNNDVVKIIEGAVLSVAKSATPVCGVPLKSGETVTYRIEFSNIGDEVPTPKEISIDGSIESGVLLEDALPPNMTFSKLSDPVSAPNLSIVLVQLKADKSSDNWTLYEKWDGEAVISKIGLYIPVSQVQPNQSGKLEFEVTVNENVTSTTVYNQAKFDLGNDGGTEFYSNNVCTSIEPGSTRGGEGEQTEGNLEAEIRFLTPVLDIKKSITQGEGSPSFYNSDDFEDALIYNLDNNLDNYDVIRDGVYIELISSAVNVNEDTADTIVVTVTSGTGDTLLVTLLETGANTGIFRSLSPIKMSDTETGNGGSCPGSGMLNPNYTAAASSCVLNGAADGNLSVTVSVSAGGQTVEVLEDAALIDPLGIVFDSAYNTPVTGATVWIRNDDGSVALDPLTDQAYAPQVTGEDGRYQFPYLYGGQSYYLDVIPPTQYTFPSVVSASSFGPGRTVNEFSYGKDGYEQIAGSGIFTLTSLLVVDIPLDPELDTDLSVYKTSSVSEVSVGGSLNYSISIKNHSGRTLYAVKVNDYLPRGFNYVEGTATLNGESIDDPAGAPRPNLVFSNLPFTEGEADGVLTADEEHTLTYRVRTTAGAVGSDGTNTAQATGRTETSVLLESNESKAKVSIERDGVLADKAIIFGKVYVDTDCNNIQNDGEWPVGGVKLYLQDGTWVITDANGQYSIYGLEPGDYVIKMDPITLPKGIIFKPTDNRQMADPESRLMDLKGGEFHRADFVAACPIANRDDIRAEIFARNAGQTDWMMKEAQNYDPDKELDSDALKKSEDLNGDISNGTDFKRTKNADKSKSGRGSLTTGYSIQLNRFREERLANSALNQLSAALRKEAHVYQSGDFYTVRHGFDLDKKSTNARMKALKLPKDARVVTTIYERMSDEVVDRLEAPRGLESMTPAKVAVTSVTNAQAKSGTWLWPKDDVSLDGRFMVVVRKGLTPTLMLNGKAVPQSQLGERIENRRERAQVVAWYGIQLLPGKNELEVVATDSFGNKRSLAKGTFKRPVSAEKIVLEARVKRLPADGGRSYLPLTIKLLDANGYLARGVNFVTLEASDGQWVERDVQDKVQGRQVRVVNGLRTVHFRSSERSGEVKVRVSDGSMRANIELRQTAPLRPLLAVGVLEVGGHIFERGSNSPDFGIEDEVSSRAAVFMKGRIRGDMHLTMSVDTDKDDEAQLFRDINPNKSYPIHGDSSQRGYEAQSRSKVYAKLERDSSSAMWGDFVTDGNSMNEDVTRVQRTLTGANIVAISGRNQAQLFASELDEKNIIERIRGEGVALNYKLANANIVTNSETMEIITVSRDNSGVVLSSTTLSRFGDYTLDYVTGELSFSETVPMTDEDLNPVYIRATYDVEGTGDKYLVAGARLKSEVLPGLKLGANYTSDQHETEGYELYGATIEYNDKKGLKVGGSVGQMTHSDLTVPKGTAGRLYVEREWKGKDKTTVTLGRATEGFTNSAGGISENREEARIKHETNLRKGVKAEVEAIHSKSLDTGDLEQSIGVTADVKVKDWTLKSGVRHVEQDTSSTDESYQTFILGAKKLLNIGGKKGSLGVEYEQDFQDAGRRRIAIDADMQLHDKVKVYARGERTSSLTASTTSEQDTIAVGIKSNFIKSTELFSEYRVRGAIDSRDLETASGIRGTYEIAKGLSVAPHLEIVNNLSDGDDSVAASITLKDTRSTDQVASLRLETRHDDSREYYGMQADYVKRLGTKWSVLAKDTLRYEIPESGDDTLDNTFTLGFAYRPRRDNRNHALFYYQNKEERGGDNGDCSTHILSTHQNYEINEDVMISGRLGGKQENCDGIDSNAAVLDGRITWDLTNRLDVDLHGGVLATDGFGEQQYSFGAGINYLLRRNLRIGAGYNVTGFKDEDLDPDNYNDEGLYMGLKYKFDENSLNWLSGE